MREPTSSSQRACWSSCFSRGSSGSSTSRPLPRSSSACSLEESGISSDSATWARSWKSSTFSSNSWRREATEEKREVFCDGERGRIIRENNKRKEKLKCQLSFIKVTYFDLSSLADDARQSVELIHKCLELVHGQFGAVATAFGAQTAAGDTHEKKKKSDGLVQSVWTCWRVSRSLVRCLLTCASVCGLAAAELRRSTSPPL